MLAGELPVAYVQLAGDATVNESELLAFAAENVSERAAIPKEVHIVATIPLTDVGKPHKVKLRQDAAQRVFAGAIAAALNGIAQVGVEVSPDESHGTVVIITLELGTDAARHAAEVKIHGVMKQYALHYELR